MDLKHNKNKNIYDFSDNIRRVSLITGISIIVIIIVFFIPIINSVFIIIGKIIALALLSYAFILNLNTTNKTMSNISNIFVDPSKSNVRDIMILSYVFSISIFVLIGFIIHSFFRQG
jgi:hypothetical protein